MTTEIFESPVIQKLPGIGNVNIASAEEALLLPCRENLNQERSSSLLYSQTSEERPSAAMRAKYHRTAYPSISGGTLVEEITIPLFSKNVTEQRSRICISLSPKPRYINPADQQAAFRIVRSLTRTPISIFYADEAGDVTGCLTSNKQRLKFVRNSSDMLLDILETDRIFSFVRDKDGKLAGCSSVDEVVKYERGKCCRNIGCLTTNKIFTFDRNGDGHIVGFAVQYLRDVNNNCTSLSTSNKEFVFERDKSGNIEGCRQKEGPLAFDGGWTFPS